MGEQDTTMAEIEQAYPNEWVLINTPSDEDLRRPGWARHLSRPGQVGPVQTRRSAPECCSTSPFSTWALSPRTTPCNSPPGAGQLGPGRMRYAFDRNGRLVIIPVFLAGPRVQHTFQFAVDTAATRTGVSGLILERLGYQRSQATGRYQVRTGSGGTRAPLSGSAAGRPSSGPRRSPCLARDLSDLTGRWTVGAGLLPRARPQPRLRPRPGLAPAAVQVVAVLAVTVTRRRRRRSRTGPVP